MTHDYHDALPGYHADQIWHDGCGECEWRSQNLSRGIGTLDLNNYARAKARAIKWNSWSISAETLHISKAEAPLLNMLWAIHLQEEKQVDQRY